MMPHFLTVVGQFLFVWLLVFLFFAAALSSTAGLFFFPFGLLVTNLHFALPRLA